MDSIELKKIENEHITNLEMLLDNPKGIKTIHDIIKKDVLSKLDDNYFVFIHAFYIPFRNLLGLSEFDVNRKTSSIVYWKCNNHFNIILKDVFGQLNDTELSIIYKFAEKLNIFTKMAAIFLSFFFK